MAETIYGARLWNTPSEGVANVSALFIGSDSTVYTKGDIVAQQGGQLVVKGATSSPGIVGVILRTQTMSSANLATAKVYPKYYDLSEKNLTFLMGTNADLVATTDVGKFFTIHSDGTTAIQQVDVSSDTVASTDGEVVCVAVDPQNEGGSGAGSGLRQGLFKFIKIWGVHASI